MNWSLSWVMISKEPFSRHTRWESLKPLKMLRGGNSLAVQGLGLCASTAGGIGSIPGGGIEILQAECVGHSKEGETPKRIQWGWRG